MLSQAAITSPVRPAAHRDCKPLPSYCRTMSRYDRVQDPHTMCHACPSPPPFPTPTCSPSSLKQISPLGLLVSHLPWSKHPQVFAFSYTSLDLCHRNKKVNPGFFHQMKCSTKTLVLRTDTGMDEKGCPISNANQTPSHGSLRLLQTLWSQLCQLWSLQTKIQTPRTLKMK